MLWNQKWSVIDNISSNVRGRGNDVSLSFQGLTGPDGPAGKEGPPGEQVSVSCFFQDADDTFKDEPVGVS